MSTTQAESQLTREQFHQQAIALASEFLSLLQGRTLTTGVVLQAAMEMHRYAAKQLLPEAQGELSMGMAAYAGELLQGLPAFHAPQTTH